MAHHAGADLRDDGGVAFGGAAGLRGGAKIARVDEADELGRFAIEQRVAADGVGGGGPLVGIARGHVGGEFVRGIGAAAVAIGAAQVDGGGFVHGLDANVAFGGLAAFGSSGDETCEDKCGEADSRAH